MQALRKASGLSRRALIGAAAAPFLAPALLPARALAGPPATRSPILFVHGAGDSAACWTTQIWRFESNGFARERLIALDLVDPLARADDATPQPGRSSSAEQREQLGAALKEALALADAGQAILVAHGRGGIAARNLLADQATALSVSRLILCGTPNHGLFDSEQMIGSELNARGPLLRRLNAGALEAPPGVATLTLLSDGYDRFAQGEAAAAAVGRAGLRGPGPEGPALNGALNVVLGPYDHRELAYGPRAFREMARFILGRDPDRVSILSEAQPVLSGVVTGFPKGTPTNRPLADATVEIYRCDPQTGVRLGEPILQKITGADGRWGPVTVRPDWPLEFALTAPGHPATHIYRAPFPRSTTTLNLRPARALEKGERAAAVVLMTRPRGYFGLPRDVVSLGGREPDDITRGVPSDATTVWRVAPQDMDRPVVGLFNEERIAARPWPASEERVSVIELTS